MTLIAPFISGLLTGLSFNFPFLSFLIWFSLTPTVYFLIKENNLKRIILGGIIFSFLYYGVSIFWITKVTKLGFSFLLIYLAIYCVLFFIFAKKLVNRPLSIISIPCLWVVLELLKEIIWCGFGWANLGYCQYKSIHLIQVVDLFGAKFISFLIVLVNILVVQIFLFLRENKRDKKIQNNIKKKIVIVVCIFFVCFLYSVYKLNTLDQADSLRVSIVQSNVTKDEDSSTILKRLYSLGSKAEDDTLVIYPEAAWPVTIESFYGLQSFAVKIKKDVLIGSVMKEQELFYNAALLFNKKGHFLDSYRKMNLVPFGEYVPMRKYLNFVSVLNTIGDMARGNEATLFSYKNKNFSVLICFEDILPLHVSKVSKQRDFLINITSDSWFGGQPEANQHLSIMTMRAIENKISIIRSSDIGPSGWVSAVGRIKNITLNGRELFFDGVESFKISLGREESVYNKYGEFFPIICFIFIVMVFIPKINSKGEKK